MDETFGHLHRLLDNDIESFCVVLSDLNENDLVRLVGLLQQSIQEEQLRFYHLTEQLKLAHNSELKENLSGELYLTQNRMAQLCAKNTKCYEKSYPVTNGESNQYSPLLHQRKSLSTLYKAKQLKENGSHIVSHQDQQNYSKSSALPKTDINGNTTETDSSNIRNAFQSVLSDIFGREVDIDSDKSVGNKNHLEPNVVLVDQKPKQQISRSYALDYVNNTVAYPIKITNAAKRNEFEIEESKRRILEQVKRVRQGKENVSKSNSIDLQPFVGLTDKKPLRSILKKKTMSTSVPNLNGNGSNPSTPVISTVRHSVDIEQLDIVTQSTIELRRTSLEPDKKVVSLKLNPVNVPGYTSLRPTVTNISDQKTFSPKITIEDVRRDLPDVVNDPNKKHNFQSPIRSPAASSTMETARKMSYPENSPDKIYHHKEHDAYRDWDPRLLLENLYDIDYTPRVDKNERKFVDMEGYLEHLPLGLRVAVVDNLWRNHYFKTKSGRLLWYENPDTDIVPFGDILLSGTDLDMDKNENTLLIHGGKEGTLLKLKCPSHLLDKWRKALLSHGSAAAEETFVKPVYPPFPSSSDSVCIIELGSCSIRAGVLTTEPSLPQLFFPATATVFENEVVVSQEALLPEVRHKGTFVQPIKPTNTTSTNRYNVDLNIIRHVFKKIFTDLNINSNDYEIMLSLPQNAPVNMISDLMKILLNEFGVKAVGVAKQPYLILYSYDVTTGVVVDLGDHLNIVPVIDGYIVQNAIISLPYGGSKIADVLRSKLSEQNPGVYSFMSPVERYILRYIVEQTCYVAEDYDEEIEKYEKSPADIDTVVKLDRFDLREETFRELRVDSTRFTCTEGLFKPKRWSLDVEGLHKLIYQAIQSAPMDSRRLLYKNIYLAGGSSLLPGLPQRLESELTKLAPSSVQVCIRTSPWRYHSAYIGAQVLAGSSQFEQTLITSSKLDTFIRQLHSANF